MTVHATLTEFGPRWITLCHTCGTTVSHTDPDTACRAVCHCRKDTRAKTITEDVA